MTILEEIAVTPGDQHEILSAMKRAQSLNPDVLMACVYTPSCLEIVRSAASLDWMPRAWGMTSCTGANLSNEIGADSAFISGPEQWNPTLEGENFTETDQSLFHAFPRT